MRALLALLVAALLLPGAALGGDADLTGEQMEDLLARIRQLVVEAHPDPYAAMGQEAFEQRYAEVLASCQRPMSPGAFQLEASRLLSALGDAHTALHGSSGDRWLPLRLAWTSDGLGIVGAEDPKLVGSHILSIGGRSPEALLPELDALISSENLEHVRHQASTWLTRESVLRQLLGSSVSRGVRLRLERDGAPRTVRLGFDDQRLRSGADVHMPWDWAVIPELATGWFALRSCPSPTEGYRRDVADLFYEMAVHGARHLVIDVRGNGGGNSRVLDALLERLPAEEIVDYGGLRRLSPHALEQRELDPSWFTMQEGSDLTEPSGSTWSKPARARRLTPFDGQVWVLTDAATFSSGNWVAVVLSDNGLARVVGEATGNAPSSFGDALGWDLGQGLWLSVSFSRWLRPDGDRDPAATLEPDEPVPTRLADLVAGVDPQFAWLARRLHPEGEALTREQIEALRPAFRARPVVVSTNPPAGATGVDPALDRVTATFSEPMGHGSWSFVGASRGAWPESGDAVWIDDRTIELPVTLEPDTLYGVGFNSRQYANFKAEDGRPSVPYELVFETAP